MTDGDPQNTPSSPVGMLAGAIGKIIERLHDQVLLFALGAAIVLALVGILGPAASRPLVLALAAVSIVAMLVSAATRRPPSARSSGRTNERRIGARARLRGSAQRILGAAGMGNARNRDRIGKDATVIDSGQVIDVSTPEQPRSADSR